VRTSGLQSTVTHMTTKEKLSLFGKVACVLGLLILAAVALEGPPHPCHDHAPPVCEDGTPPTFCSDGSELNKEATHSFSGCPPGAEPVCKTTAARDAAAVATPPVAQEPRPEPVTLAQEPPPDPQSKPRRLQQRIVDGSKPIDGLGKGNPEHRDEWTDAKGHDQVDVKDAPPMRSKPFEDGRDEKSSDKLDKWAKPHKEADGEHGWSKWAALTARFFRVDEKGEDKERGHDGPTKPPWHSKDDKQGHDATKQWHYEDDKQEHDGPTKPPWHSKDDKRGHDAPKPWHSEDDKQEHDGPTKPTWHSSNGTVPSWKHDPWQRFKHWHEPPMHMQLPSGTELPRCTDSRLPFEHHRGRFLHVLFRVFVGATLIGCLMAAITAARRRRIMAALPTVAVVKEPTVAVVKEPTVAVVKEPTVAVAKDVKELTIALTKAEMKV